MADYTILLIDYDPRSIERTKLALEEAGFGVEVATDGEAGFKLFEKIRPDMVLTEAMIPKKHGFELCQEIKKTAHGKNTPVIIITAVYKGRKYRTQAFHIYGCDEYIEKPIEGEKLAAICRKMLKVTEQASEPEPVVELVEEAAGEPEEAAEIEEVVELSMESEEEEMDPELAALAEDAAADFDDEDDEELLEPDPEEMLEAENEIVACLDALLPGEEKKAKSP